MTRFKHYRDLVAFSMYCYWRIHSKKWYLKSYSDPIINNADWRIINEVIPVELSTIT